MTTPIGEAIAAKIDDLGLRQWEAAEKMGTTQQTVSKWIGGQIPDREYATPIARFLGLPVADVRSQLSRQRREKGDDRRSVAQRLRALESAMHEAEERDEEIARRIDQLSRRVAQILDGQ